MPTDPLPSHPRATYQPWLTRRRFLSAAAGLAGLYTAGRVAAHDWNGPLTGPARSSTPACRVGAPLRVDWVGGSDVVLRDVDLPALVAERLPSIGGRPLDLRAATTIAPMADDTASLVRSSIDDGADAVIVSLNPTWQHWDEQSCADVEPPHLRYHCLQTPRGSDVDELRTAEMQSLADTLAGSGRPAYAYTIPHSTTALVDPLIADDIVSAEAWFAGFDPGLAHVEFVATSFSRYMQPLHEGVDFYDMVHPMPAGAARLADRFATDLRVFIGGLDLDPC